MPELVRTRPAPHELVAACRVPDSVPPQVAGVWTLDRLECPPAARRFAGYLDARDDLPPTYTLLGRATLETLDRPYGEIVMEDTPRELRRHLPILLRAHGRVLVSGLGLGCVVRGLLRVPAVEHVDVVEIDPAIVRMIGPEFEAEPRVRIHLGDALTIPWPEGARWDFAWHDVWCEEGSLDVLHAELLARYRSRCTAQGAWQFDRRVKRRWPDRLVNSRRRHPAGAS